jgi:hypothetical protein
MMMMLRLHCVVVAVVVAAIVEHRYGHAAGNDGWSRRVRRSGSQHCHVRSQSRRDGAAERAQARGIGAAGAQG